MKKNNYDFPYPVLRSDDILCSGYLKDKYFNIQVKEPDKEDNKYKFDIQYFLSSFSIINLIDTGKARVALFYYTNNTRKCYNMDLNGDPLEVIIDPYKFTSVDSITFYAYVVANEDFIMEYNEEMDQNFDFGDPFTIAKNDILAISDKLIFNYNRSGKTIVKIRKSPDLVNGIKVKYDESDFIVILISEQFKDSYDSIVRKQNNIPIQKLINSSLLNMAFIKLFTELCVNGYNEHENKRWFKVISSTLLDKDINFEERLKEINSSGGVDMNDIFDMVDTFLNHYFEKVINNCKEVLEN